MHDIDLTVEPSGCDEFDRALAALTDGRDDEALDWFEIASTSAADATVRASAGAFAAGILLSLGRPWEVESWAELLRAEGGSADLANLLEASACVQLEDLDRALELLDGATEPSDRWFPCTATQVQIVRAHAHYRRGDTEIAEQEVLGAFRAAPFASDVWDAFARLCAETEFDPAPVVALVPDERILDVLAALQHSEPAGVDAITELLWNRNRGDARVLALVPKFAAKLENDRCLEWSARLRSAGMGRLCPLLRRADDPYVDAPDRVQAAALVYATFGDKHARGSLEAAVSVLADDELNAAVANVWTLAKALTDSVVVAGAVTTVRSLTIATALHEGGAIAEAYAVLVHGLTMDDADDLETETFVRLVPVPTLDALGVYAREHGDEQVADMVEALAVVARVDLA